VDISTYLLVVAFVSLTPYELQVSMSAWLLCTLSPHTSLLYQISWQL